MDLNNNIPPHQNFHTYNRNGRVSQKGSGNNTPYTRQLAAFRSASVIPHPDPVEGSPKEEKALPEQIAETSAIPKDRTELELPHEITPKHIDETTRSALENRVRIKKRKHEKCPFTGANGECFRPDIRCGERAQYSERESEKQHDKPHRCLYTPYFPSDNVIVVENDPLQREFILDTFKLFLSYDMEKIASINTPEAATEVLTRYKLQNRMIGLIILSSDSLGSGAVRFLNELYDRNINAEIILTGSVTENELETLKPFTKRELIPGVSFISKYLQTPIHTEKFLEAINTLHFGRFL